MCVMRLQLHDVTSGNVSVSMGQEEVGGLTQRMAVSGHGCEKPSV